MILDKIKSDNQQNEHFSPFNLKIFNISNLTGKDLHLVLLRIISFHFVLFHSILLNIIISSAQLKQSLDILYHHYQQQLSRLNSRATITERSTSDYNWQSSPLQNTGDEFMLKGCLNDDEKLPIGYASRCQINQSCISADLSLYSVDALISYHF